jgi:hypothetical protein
MTPHQLEWLQIAHWYVLFLGALACFGFGYWVGKGRRP